MGACSYSSCFWSLLLILLLLTVSSSSAQLRTSPSRPITPFIWRYQLHSFSWCLLSDRFVKALQPPITVFPWCKDNAGLDILHGLPVDCASASDPTRNQEFSSSFPCTPWETCGRTAGGPQSIPHYRSSWIRFSDRASISLNARSIFVYVLEGRPSSSRRPQCCSHELIKVQLPGTSGWVRLHGRRRAIFDASTTVCPVHLAAAGFTLLPGLVLSPSKAAGQKTCLLAADPSPIITPALALYKQLQLWQERLRVRLRREDEPHPQFVESNLDGRPRDPYHFPRRRRQGWLAARSCGCRPRYRFWKRWDGTPQPRNFATLSERRCRPIPVA
ncbi:hypothetical protein PV04_03382 [Phialophora macrospora]|uniref:Uncharacterized protein n=1 Tax=Phialophora macrospora TaxID=1851006 RepID=A0A0D2D122_9EURO|nr:hypothetical protein PV04_03382 [Phialophora macrospora]